MRFGLAHNGSDFAGAGTSGCRDESRRGRRRGRARVMAVGIPGRSHFPVFSASWLKPEGLGDGILRTAKARNGTDGWQHIGNGFRRRGNRADRACKSALRHSGWSSTDQSRTLDIHLGETIWAVPGRSSPFRIVPNTRKPVTERSLGDPRVPAKWSSEWCSERPEHHWTEGRRPEGDYGVHGLPGRTAESRPGLCLRHCHFDTRSRVGTGKGEVSGWTAAAAPGRRGAHPSMAGAP